MDAKSRSTRAHGLADGAREPAGQCMKVALCLASRPQPALWAALQLCGHQVQGFDARCGPLPPTPDVVIVDGEVLAEPVAAQAITELSQHTAVVLVTDESAPWPAALDDGLRAMALLPHPIEIAALLANLPLWVQRHREAWSLRKAEADLLAALLSSRRISSAVGMLAERHGISIDEAFNRLRNQARARRQRTEDLAQGIVAGEDTSR